MFRGRRTARAAAAIALLALLLAASGPARATTLKDRAVDCPVCTKPFTALEVKSTNTFGGYDSDLCVHAHGTPPASFLVWTCPSCRYSARSSRFPKGVSDATRKRILSGWPEAPAGFPAKGDQRSIPAWQKYELAGRILDEEKGKTGERLAFWRDAAFAERCDSMDALDPEDRDGPLGPGFDAALGRVLDLAREIPPHGDGRRTRAGRQIAAAREALAEAAKSPPAERHFLELAAAAVLRSRGEFGRAAKALSGLAAAKDAPEAVRSAARALLESIDREKAFLGRAVGTVRLPKEELPKLVLDDEPGARSGWTLAESFRRLGEDDQAEAFARAALGSKSAGDWMFLLSREVLSAEGAGGPRWTAAAKEAGAAWEKRLLARLRDEEAGEEAAAVLGRLGDPALVPALLEALRGEDTTAAQFAAAALGGFAEPGAAAEEALAKIVADEEADVEVRWRATEALSVLAPEAARPALLAAAGSGGVVREAAIRGLGRAGEADAFPVLLAAAKEDPKAALPALSLAATREFKDVGAAAAWWEKNRSRTRAEWTRDAFREAGADLPSPPTRASAPRLMELLENPSRPVRWAAFRALRSISGRSLGREEVLDEGEVKSPTKAVAPYTVEEVLGEGRIVFHGQVPEWDMGEFLGKVSPDLKTDNARPSWERARAQWRRWWREQGGK
jgi:HEAT repeat protein